MIRKRSLMVALALGALGCGDDSTDPPGPATRLEFAAAPSHVTTGEPFDVTVRAERSDGSLDVSYADSITVGVASGPGALTGMTSRAAEAGVAEFTDLSVTLEGTYALNATSGTLSAAISPAIESSPQPPRIRTGMFSGMNGYITEGSVEIIIEPAGQETLRTGLDFRVSGGAGSISVWLTDSTGAVSLRNTSVKVHLGTITSGFTGVYTYDVPDPGSAGYTHVVTYCDAARVNFGMAELSDPS